MKGIDVLIQIGDNYGIIFDTYERLSSSKMLVLGAGGRRIAAQVDARYVIDDRESYRGIVLDSEWLLDNAMSCHCLVCDGMPVRVHVCKLLDDGAWSFGLCADPKGYSNELNYFDPESLQRCLPPAKHISRSVLAKRGWWADGPGYRELHATALSTEVTIGKKLPLRYTVELILSEMEESAE